MSATARSTRIARAVLAALEVAAGVGAVYGGVGLIAGNAIGMPADWLAATPFPDWVVPGVLLLAIVGVPMLVAAAAVLSRARRAAALSLTAGLLQIGWIIGQWIVIGRYDPLQPTMLALGVAVSLLALSQRTRP